MVFKQKEARAAHNFLSASEKKSYTPTTYFLSQNHLTINTSILNTKINVSFLGKRKPTQTCRDGANSTLTVALMRNPFFFSHQLRNEKTCKRGLAVLWSYCWEWQRTCGCRSKQHSLLTANHICLLAQLHVFNKPIFSGPDVQGSPISQGWKGILRASFHN